MPKTTQVLMDFAGLGPSQIKHAHSSREAVSSGGVTHAS